MALLLCSNHLAFNALPSRSAPLTIFTATTYRMQMNPVIDPHPKSFNGVRLHMPVVVKRSVSLVVKASSDPIEGTEALSGIKEEVVPVDKLPLESKLKKRLEEKTRMKLAKKIRLRRKRLVQKRKLRKKGRWPPSKMNKLKNV
ncbi:50S ribosomal protein 5, chloroplastic [Argentina anserina]|uniref:50S ribosomal protein 5, chloroplastic n=1 Tax=Argentina anserina TaxID=57926 RepID=UPI0021768A6E|nr:50S ribosomal protein 5, chloroplastic [Potentilla anserina]XP_050386954.1 50S ribosomal protein 5, chloroplastic [Potentilla anserina]XP_050386955.1 50S ribosomal protein 5, chloroplastic [Potentilla anserina]